MRFLYTGIACGEYVNTNNIYTGEELVKLIVNTINLLYNTGWDLSPDDVCCIDTNNITLDDILFCQELCGADIILPSKL